MGVYKKILIEANFEIKKAKIIEKRLCRQANKAKEPYQIQGEDKA